MKIFSTCLLALYGLSHLAYAEETPKQEAEKTLNTIIISSSRIEEPLKSTATAITVLTQEDIEKSGQSNLADLLRTTPGIGVSNAGGIGKATALRIRGEEGYRTLVMLDGVDVSDPTGTQVGPQIQHLLLGKYVDRVEVLRGPQGFIYGADVGGGCQYTFTSGRG